MWLVYSVWVLPLNKAPRKARSERPYGHPLSSISFYSPGSLKLDILTEIIDHKTFDDLISHTVIIGDNIMLTLPMSLGVKLRCWYLRQEDENGVAKKISDLRDILFVARKMKGAGIEVDHISAAAAEAKTEESAILLLARNGHHQNLLVIRPKPIISSLLYI